MPIGLLGAGGLLAILGATVRYALAEIAGSTQPTVGEPASYYRDVGADMILWGAFVASSAATLTILVVGLLWLSDRISRQPDGRRDRDRAT